MEFTKKIGFINDTITPTDLEKKQVYDVYDNNFSFFVKEEFPIYNKVIEYFRLNNKKPTKEFMRAWIKEKNKEFTWFKDVPYNLKDETTKQAFASIEGKETRLLQGKKSGFIGFRTKKDLRQVIPVRTQNINFEQFKIYPSTLIDACKDLDSSYKRVKKKSHQAR